MALLKALLKIAEAIAGKLAADEIMAWLPSLSQRLLNLAVSWFPEEQRARYAEEWETDLLCIPGGLSQLFYSLGFVVASVRINWSIALLLIRLLLRISLLSLVAVNIYFSPAVQKFSRHKYNPEKPPKPLMLILGIGLNSTLLAVRVGRQTS